LSNGQVTWPSFALPAEARAVRTVTLQLNSVLPAGVTAITNTASASHAATEPTPSDNTASQVMVVDAAPDLQITATGAIVAGAGQIVTYTLSFANMGNQGATGVLIHETVPDNTEVIHGTANWACPVSPSSPAICTLPLGDLASGATGEVHFVVRVKDALSASVDMITSTVQIDDDGLNGVDLQPDNNKASITTQTESTPLLTIQQTAKVMQTSSPSKISYTLVISNNGAHSASSIAITEVVPALTTFQLDDSTPGWACTFDDDSRHELCVFVVDELLANSASKSLTFVVAATIAPFCSVYQIENKVLLGATENIVYTPGNQSCNFLPLVFRVDS
jgi:uncharacterized repeat protein (TIGR01451 family)